MNNLDSYAWVWDLVFWAAKWEVRVDHTLRVKTPHQTEKKYFLSVTSVCHAHTASFREKAARVEARSGGLQGGPYPRPSLPENVID